MTRWCGAASRLAIVAAVAGLAGLASVGVAQIPHRAGALIDEPAAPPTRPSTVTVTPPPMSAPATAASILEPPPPPPPATMVGANVPRQIRVNVAWQIALEAADYSPGIIDGHFKRKSLMALSEYAAQNFPGATPFDKRVFAALKVAPDAAVAAYKITDDDALQVGYVPDDWNAKAKMDRLRYENMAECISEKFHCTKVLLETLNPGVKLADLAPGQTVLVPNIRPFPVDNKPVVPRRASGTGWVTINLAEKTIRLFDPAGKQIALFHCSVAKDKAKLPARDTVVKAIAAPNPDYTFNPSMWPEVRNVKQVLRIPPGPRNPVGLAWVSLDLPGYGIHGVPKPELIGKTGSHGCFRLTNWDALKFAGMVKEGMTVKIMNPERE